MSESDPTRGLLSQEAQEALAEIMNQFTAAGMIPKYHKSRQRLAMEECDDYQIGAMVYDVAKLLEENNPIAVKIEDVHDLNNKDNPPKKYYILTKVHPVIGREIDGSAVDIGYVADDGRYVVDLGRKLDGFTEEDLILMVQLAEFQAQSGIVL